MVNITNAIVGLICSLLVDMFFTFLCMLHIRLEAKKKWNKYQKLYPYINYSFYKKIFFLGLKGDFSRVNVVLTFIAHIGTILTLIFCVLVCCFQNIAVMSYCFRAIMGVELLLLLARPGCLLGFPLNL